MKEVIEKIEECLSGDLSAPQFIIWFEDWFYKFSPSQCEEELYQILANLNDDLGYYVEESSIQKEHSSYFGPKELEKLLKEAKFHLTEKE